MRVVTLCLCAMLVGCGDGAARSGDPIVAVYGDWPFAPTVLRVHPFTALTHSADGKTYILDTRIELLDPAGDTTKGVGTLRIELYSMPSRVSQANQGVRVEMWDIQLLTLEQNKAYYDAITRTYRFRLKCANPPPLRDDLRLQVQFTDPRGRRLAAEGDVGEKPMREE